MTSKKFKNESQDARRRDQHNATHPYEKENSRLKTKEPEAGKKK